MLQPSDKLGTQMNSTEKTTTVDVQSRGYNKILKSLLSRSEISGLIMFAIIVLGFHLWTSYFISVDNLGVILGVAPEIGLVALGVAVLMISGEFDLSVGSVFALAPMLAVILMRTSLNPWIAIVISLSATMGIGYINGFITLKFEIPSFVTTLGMLFIARSATLILSGGFPPPFPPEVPVDVFVLKVGTLRISLAWYLAIAILLIVFLQKTNLGSWIYATGGGKEAAKNMGINTSRIKIISFMICSFLAGFAGIIQTFRLQAALPSIGIGLELEAIAAAVIGGCLLTGGVGTMIGAVIGALLIRVIDNGLIMARVDANYFKAAIGGLTILAVVMNTYIGKIANEIKE
jgi:ribose/xylose/arabinose/galactoside ABC-type transport system permease subunit